MRKFWLKVALVMVLGGGLVFFLLRIDYRVAISEPVDINAEGYLTDVSQLQKGMAVDTHIDKLVGPIMTETITRKSRLMKSTRVYHHYAMPVFVGDEVYYLAYKVNDEDTFAKNAVDKIASVTMKYLYGETDYYGTHSLSISGGIVEADSGIRQDLVKGLTDSGMFETEVIASKYVLDLSLEKMSRDNVRKVLYGNLAALALGILILIILLFSTFFGREKYSKRKKQLEALGNKTITINGRDYVVRSMTIDKMIWDDKIPQAKRELMTKYMATEEEAARIIENWRFITRL
ncbi:MAG: hypothetical protein IKL04_05365 [Lachnospiraceae bacterium]|nr:hypothetical protein [Lachnospiraceae bacterium]